MKLVIAIILVLTIAIIAQLARVYEISSLMRKRSDEEISNNENKINATLMLLFLFGYLTSVAYLVIYYGDTLGPAASAHGVEIDNLLNFNWAILFFVFVFTHILLFFFAFKYYYKKGRKAFYYPHNNKLELIWTVVPAVVLAVIIIYGLNTWNTITGKPQSDNVKVVEFYAKQFDWTARLAGEDNKLGYTDYKLITGTNPLGILTAESYAEKMEEYDKKIEKLEDKIHHLGKHSSKAEAHELNSKLAKVMRMKERTVQLKSLINDSKASDDDVVLKGEIALVKDQTYQFVFRSRDVIHSAYFPHFRAQMNCVPGTGTMFSFTPTVSTKEMKESEFMKKKYERINRIRREKGLEPVDHDYILLCNKICGQSHYNMQMKIVVFDTQEEYDQWYKKKDFKTFKESLAAN